MNINEIIDSAGEVFKRKVMEKCEEMSLKGRELSPDLAEKFTAGLAESLRVTGIAALKDFVENYDEKMGNQIEKKEKKYYWKIKSEKRFLTSLGEIKIERNIYQSEDGECYVPVDEKWGMQKEFATLEVREMILYMLAHLTPQETKEHLEKWGWFKASETAIKNIAKEIGYFISYRRDKIEDLIREKREIDKETRVLVASIDGTNVLINEPGRKKGRPLERPKDKQQNKKSPSSYKNAMVGSVSFYGEVPEEKKSPQRLSSHYIARMPEDKFPKLKQQLENELSDIELHLKGNVKKIVLCDGARSIWNYVDNNIFYNDYKKLLDFFHMTEHLSKASEAIFGKNSDDGKFWYKRWRLKMLEDEQAPKNLLQSLHYYTRTSNLSAYRQKDLKAEITFFRRNQHRMTYAIFLNQGLPIGSGPVEAACKNIVKHRLCRSGMRWSIRGGQRILDLRCHVKSKRWDVFWNSYKSLRFAS